jgi:glycerol kinase
MDCILAIDQGSHASRALLFDADGSVLARHEQRVDQYETHPGWVELAPEQVLASVRAVIAEVLPHATGPVRCAGLAVQRSTLVAWDRDTGEPLAPAISWQDTRCSALLQRFAHHERLIHQISGLPLSPHYLAGKMRWLLEENEAVTEAHAQGTLMMGPLSSYLTFHLLQGGPLVVDHSNAARSMLFNIAHGQWSRALAELFHIDTALLPDCVPTLANHGVLVGSGIPLACICGDQNAAIHAGGEPPDHQIMLNLGTGAFLLRGVGSQPPEHEHLIGGIAWSTATERRYLLEASVNGVGSAIRWLQSGTQTDILRQLPDWLHEIGSPPLFLNSIGGIGSPFWRQDLEPRFVPATESLGRRAVALVESIAFLIQRNLQEMDPEGIEGIQVSGGLSPMNGLCQRIADLSGLTLYRHDDPEATARGLAWLAAGRPAHWQGKPAGRSFRPGPNPALKQRYAEFMQLLEQELGLAAESS